MIARFFLYNYVVVIYMLEYICLNNIQSFLYTIYNIKADFYSL